MMNNSFFTAHSRLTFRPCSPPVWFPPNWLNISLGTEYLQHFHMKYLTHYVVNWAFISLFSSILTLHLPFFPSLHKHLQKHADRMCQGLNHRSPDHWPSSWAPATRSHNHNDHGLSLMCLSFCFKLQTGRLENNILTGKESKSLFFLIVFCTVEWIIMLSFTIVKRFWWNRSPEYFSSRVY